MARTIRHAFLEGGHFRGCKNILIAAQRLLSSVGSRLGNSLLHSMKTG